ncbi:putative vesicle fusion protein [Cryptosporidium canis]|uniref:Vesicle fusion protein n=1 Tax=Cryptosporidium canis TaxID=195482 RepID=A0A9D5DMA7_9CRYT|nr:putative vesicle fusion protein [Cryptosporidium canis]
MEEAQELCRKAEKAGKGSIGFFSSLLSGGPDYDGAIQLYAEAGNKFKILKAWREGCESFCRAAELSVKQNDLVTASNYYTECGNIMKRLDLQKAIPYFSKAVDLYNKNGRFSQSGKLYKNIAEALESDFQYLECCEYYKKAADMFDMDEYSKTAYSSCILKYADNFSLCSGRSSEASGLLEAVEIYEKEARKALGNSLIKYNAKEYLFKAYLIVLSMEDVVDAQIKWEKYSSTDQSFSTSPQGKLCRSILDIMERRQNSTGGEGNDLDNNKFVEDFSALIEEYNNIYPIDDWKVHFLSAIKKNLARIPMNTVEKAENNEFDLT